MLGVPDAARAGWELWPGGGRCPKCRKEIAGHLPVDAPAVIQKRDVVVRCSHCGKEPLRAHEMENGWHPTFHWLTTEENKKALREKRIPIPLCPGIKKAGVVIGEMAVQP